MRPFQSIFRLFRGYWSQGTPPDQKELLEDETFYEVSENPIENQSKEETQQLKRWEQEAESQERLSCLETGPFYSDKLFFKNVTPGVTKELLVNYMENVSGQNDIELMYCDEPGGVVVTFKAEIDFAKVKNKCQTKLLNERQLEVRRVAVSNSILVENLSPNTDSDHVFCYFETPRAKGGTVLTVQQLTDHNKWIVCFEDAKVVDGVLKATHILGGRELRVSLYLKCLGPSGGKTEPYVFVPPPPVKLTDADDVKICFLIHSAGMLQFFNNLLSEVHAHATVVGNVLTVSCTLTESMHRVDLQVEKWREKVNKLLEKCFGVIELQRLTVPPEIWYDTKKTIKKSTFNNYDLVIPDEEDFTFVVLGIKGAGGNTFTQIQSIAEVKEKQFELRRREKTDTKKLKKYQLELLMLSTFLSDTQSQIKVDIRLEQGEVDFRGKLTAIREVQVKMYDILQSASSTVVTDIPGLYLSLLDTKESRNAVNNRLKQAQLAATWECFGNGIIVYCLHRTALLQAVYLIQTSFKSERIFLDEVSSSLQTTSEWKDTVENLIKQHCGLLKISTNLNTIFLTAFSDVMPTITEKIRKFVSESSIYSAAFQLSPSRLKFVTLFWEDKLASIAVNLKRYKINLTLQSDGVLVRGTKQGIELVRKDLTSLSEQIVCTEELITRKESTRCLSRLWNNNELEAIACNCKCVLSHHPENVSVQMLTSNLPAEGPRVLPVQGDITQLPVDVGADLWTSKPLTRSLPGTLTLYIFTANPQRKAAFLKALDKLVVSKILEQDIEDFDKVSPDMLKDACKKYDVDLLLWDKGAAVAGMSEDVQKLKEEISSTIKKEEKHQQEIMIANLVQWYFFQVTTTGIKRIPYKKGENLLTENAYQKNQDTVELTDSKGTVYVVSFKDMTYSVKMCPSNSVKIMRKEIISDLANNASLLPETWEPLSSEESVKRVPLVKGCPEYESVKTTMSQTASIAFTINSIERIQNPELYKQYLAKKTQMNKQNNGMQAEKTLWHGTSSDAIDNINLYGFNRSFCGKNATVHGQGVYFAVNARYSMSDTYSVRDQSGRKHMYLCKVLVGYPTVGTSGIKVLPPRQGKIRYDSATDNNLAPSMYIIFNDTQAYPEYLITFK